MQPWWPQCITVRYFTSLLFSQDIVPKSLTIEVTFPEDYPVKPLLARLSQHPSLNTESLEHINILLHEQIHSGAFEPGSLMFRPFLHWLDRSITSLFHDVTSLPSQIDNPEEDSDISESSEADSESDQEASAVAAIPQKAGTEIRLVGLSLSPSVATVTFSTPKMVVSCTRCKQHEDIKTKPERYIAQSN